ncbi:MULTISPECIES: hypothetical protein [Anaeromyxobacter]|uniref:hypothetical protein n=1 Tax=Anaeromyxobacter TaxID=161492 RepID=UPI001F567417|nr:MULTISPECIES: hypothetical protein [unclassified Anaeromyxobacter]
MPAALGEAVEHSLPLDGFYFCREPITDGTGDWIGVGTGYKQSAYRFLDAATGAGDDTVAFQVSLLAEGFPIAPQPHGYHLNHGGDYLPGLFERRDARGALLGGDGPLGRVRQLHPVPGGGSALLTTTEGMITNDRHPDGSPILRLEYVREDGSRAGAAELDRAPYQLGVARTGEALVVALDGARWFGRDAAPLTGWFPLTPPLGATSVGDDTASLADGTVALRVSGVWTHVFAPGNAAASPAPQWLADRPGTRVYVVRGGRANAVVGPQLACPSTAEIEILTPSGTSCGKIQLPLEGCAWAFVGADGTAMAMSHEANVCAWRWWRGLLR